MKVWYDSTQYGYYACIFIHRCKIISFTIKKNAQSSLQKSFNNITVDGDTSTNDMVSFFSVNNQKI